MQKPTCLFSLPHWDPVSNFSLRNDKVHLDFPLDLAASRLRVHYCFLFELPELIICLNGNQNKYICRRRCMKWLGSRI